MTLAPFMHKTALAKRYGFVLPPDATAERIRDGHSRKGVHVQCQRCGHRVLWHQLALMRRHEDKHTTGLLLRPGTDHELQILNARRTQWEVDRISEDVMRPTERARIAVAVWEERLVYGHSLLDRDLDLLRQLVTEQIERDRKMRDRMWSKATKS